jgi:AAA15 family ATPase/GTPase
VAAGLRSILYPISIYNLPSGSKYIPLRREGQYGASTEQKRYTALIDEAGGYLMIKTLHVENFRCYESLDLHGLKRINVIVGKNASGKTALLESIFLAAGGSPELAMRLRVFRGMGRQTLISADRMSFESVLRDLFFSLDQTKKIVLRIMGSDENTASLQISYSDQNVLTLPLEMKNGTSVAGIYPLDFKWKDHAGKETKGSIRFGGDKGFEVDQIIDTVRCAFFSPGADTPPQEHATRFSDLSVRDKLEPFLKAVIDEFSFIKGLSLEIVGGITMIHASLHGISGKLPLGSVSSGVMKFLYLLLAIATYGKGVILVDEIENGFYYDRLPQLWSRLSSFCQENECQLFVTTHSLECLNAMLDTVEKNQDQFSLIRTTRDNQNRIGASVFSGKALTSLIRQGLDPRG